MVDLRYVIFRNQNDEMYTELTTRRYITILFHQSSFALNIAPWFNWLVWISTIIFVLWHLFYNDKSCRYLHSYFISWRLGMLLLANTIMHCKPVQRYSIRTFYTNAYYRTVQCIAKPNILIWLSRNNLGCFFKLFFERHFLWNGTLLHYNSSHLSRLCVYNPPPLHF